MSAELNLVDGLDGLATGIVAIAAGSFFLYSEQLIDAGVISESNIGPLIAMSIFMGVFPNVFLKPMEPAVTRIVERVQAHQPASARIDNGALRLGTPASAPGRIVTGGN